MLCVSIATVAVLAVLASASSVAFAQTPDQVQIGLLLPVTGDFSDHTAQNIRALMLARDDFNDHLGRLDADWRIVTVQKDTQSAPGTALEQLESFNSSGIKLIVGPETSASIARIKDFADANDILLVSCCSTAPSLAIADDSVYRLIPDDTHQAAALAGIMQSDGIDILVPVWRDDVWGSGFDRQIRTAFGPAGTVDPGVSYAPGTSDFDSVTAELAQKVQQHTDRHGAGSVGVFVAGLDEVVPLVRSAAGHDILDNVRWYGTAPNAGDVAILEDDTVLAFSRQAELVALLPSAADNDISKRIIDDIRAQFSVSPRTYTLAAYDSLWLVGLGILEANSTDASNIRQVMPDVASQYTGAIGDIRLNEAGDLIPIAYDIWQISGDRWERAGIYDAQAGSVTLYGPDASRQAVCRR